MLLSNMTGRIDVHSHLLPGIDDGCADVAESIHCARRMVEAGYSHSFCTPHIWPNLNNDAHSIKPRVEALQKAFDEAGINLKLMPGGEMHIDRNFTVLSPDELVSYNNNRKYALFDFWTSEMQEYFEACVNHIKKTGMQPILAHPERIEAIQQSPSVMDWFEEIGLWVQCNLECLGDDERSTRRRLAERWLSENRYFMLGSDLHRTNGMDRRLLGLKRAEEIVGKDKVWELTHTNPGKLI